MSMLGRLRTIHFLLKTKQNNGIAFMSHINPRFLSSASSPLLKKYKELFPSIPFVPSVVGHSQQIYDKRFDNVEKTPKYDHNVEINPIHIEKNKQFDVISLLSTKGDTLVRCGGSSDDDDKMGSKNEVVVKAESLRGKYILVCCAFVPSFYNESCSRDLQRLSLLSSELSGTNPDFEIVLVAKMREDWGNDEGVFDHFNSVFSGRLAVPFSDKYRRDYICKLLNFDGTMRVVLVDPNLKVLQDDIRNIVDYGTAAFPFTDEMVQPFKRELLQPNFCQPLAGLLSCEPTFVLHKSNSGATSSVDEVNKKLVGLYLCREGDMLVDLINLSRRCKRHKLELEIVLVYLPFETAAHPDSFLSKINAQMTRSNTHWWVFPFKYSACIRLFNMSDKYSRDSLIIVGAESKFADEDSGWVVRSFYKPLGLCTYPFTRRAAAQAYWKSLEDISIESLLCHGSTDYVYRGYKFDDGHGTGELVPVSELKNKNVVVYITRYFSCDHGVVDEWYPKIKAIDPDFELVFVSMPSEEGNYDDDESYEYVCNQIKENVSGYDMRWLVRPYGPKPSQLMRDQEVYIGKSNYIPNKTRLYGFCPGIKIAFGKDGHIHSVNAFSLLEREGLDVYPFSAEKRNLWDKDYFC